MHKLQVFLSSSMAGDLSAERQGLRILFGSNPVLNDFFVLYAIEDHASPANIRDAYLQEIDNSQIVICLLGDEFRSAVKEEFVRAVGNGCKVLCYIRESRCNRDARLDEFIREHAHSSVHCHHFHDAQSLSTRIQSHLRNLLLRAFVPQNDPEPEYVSLQAAAPKSRYAYHSDESVRSFLEAHKDVHLTVDQLIQLAVITEQDTGRTKDALLLLEAALYLEPNNWMVLNNQGNSLQAMGLVANAISSYQRSVHINPGCATTLCNLGNAYFELGQYDVAVSHYERALSLEPAKHKALSRLSACYLKMKDPKPALEWAQRAYELQADEVCTANLALALALAGSFDDALRKQRELKEDSFTFTQVGAFISLQAREPQGALGMIEVFERTHSLRQELLILKFRSLVAMGRKEEALRAFVSLEERFPISPVEFNDLAFEFGAKFGSSEFVSSCYEKAIGADPFLPEAWNNLQACLGELGKLQEGLDACNRALTHLPLDPKSIANKGLFLMRLGRYRELFDVLSSKITEVLGPLASQLGMDSSVKKILMKYQDPLELMESLHGALGGEPKVP